MILYHFTAHRFVEPILKRGITIGGLLVNTSPVRLRRDVRWLTVRGHWGQEWAEGTGLLPYSRNEARLTVNVPKNHEGRIVDWMKDGCRFTTREIFNILNGFGDPSNWRLFVGDVSPAWITNVDYRPTPKDDGATRQEASAEGVPQKKTGEHRGGE